MNDITSERLGFWDSRSDLGLAAGSGDTNLKSLEIKALTHAIGRPRTVLDAGCGNAYALVSLALQMPSCHFFGFDYSSGMVQSGKQLISENELSSRVGVCQGNLLDLPLNALETLGAPSQGFDSVYTERSIINLDTYEKQAQAVRALWDVTASGGRLVLCEAFSDGLSQINFFRESVGLPEISAPWHNRYLTIDEVKNYLPDLETEPEIIEFSGTYYFVSRVIHARAASFEGREPSYDAPINLQSLDLPSLDVCGQSKVVVFRKP